jgi:hypothetical protein
MERSQVGEYEAGPDIMEVELVGTLFLGKPKHHLEVIFRFRSISFWWGLKISHSFGKERLESAINFPLVETAGQGNDGADQRTYVCWNDAKNCSYYYIPFVN